MPGRRPILSLYVDPQSSVTPTGELVPFWSRFLVAFLRTAEELQHVVAVDMSDDPANALSVPAQGYVIAATGDDAGVRPSDIAFGQLLVAPGAGAGDAAGNGVPSEPAPWSSRLVLDIHHDALGVARDVLATFQAAGVSELLIIRRIGHHDYIDRIVAHLTALAESSDAGLRVVDGSGPGGAWDLAAPIKVAEVAAWLDGSHSAGVLAFGQFAQVRESLRRAERPIAADADGGVPLMVQLEVPTVRADASMYLSLEGAQAGKLVAESVVRALATGEAVALVLPHAVVR